MTPPDTAARLAARHPNGRRPQVMNQRWESLLFLHWSLPPARIQETLPPGLTVDTFAGDAYLGIIPFFMKNVRPIGLPAVPAISDFQELNVRTYVFANDDAVPGVWFYSLDCNQPLAVLAARTLTGLEYRNAEMNAIPGDFIEYSCRRNSQAETAQFRYRGMGEKRQSNPASLEFFLLERYYLYARRSGSVIRAQVSHQPYEYRETEVKAASALPAHWDGFIDGSEPPQHACYVDGLDVKIYATEKL